MFGRQIGHLILVIQSEQPELRPAPYRNFRTVNSSVGSGKTSFSMAPHEAERFKIRTQVQRVNVRLKEEFGARFVRARGHAKVTA